MVTRPPWTNNPMGLSKPTIVVSFQLDPSSHQLVAVVAVVGWRWRRCGKGAPLHTPVASRQAGRNHPDHRPVNCEEGGRSGGLPTIISALISAEEGKGG